jgi:hypothetical protein
MERAEAMPKKPLTPFFLFKEKEKGKGNPMSGKEAGQMWKDMSEEDKQTYVNEYQKEREKFDTYLEEEGYPRRSSLGKPRVGTGYIGGCVKAVCGTKESIKELSSKQFRALGLVAVPNPLKG